ncbi:MAG: hypothetical protein ACOYL6_16470 [Bacteriovoracaceae bacterium]
MKNPFIIRIFFIFLISNICQAEVLKLTVGKDHYLLESKDDENIVLEKGCWEKKSSCEAYSALEKISWSNYKPKEVKNGGKNPSSMFCREAHHGMIAIAKDEKGNSYSLCILKDRSVTTADTLVYASKKLKVKK